MLANFGSKISGRLLATTKEIGTINSKLWLF